MKEWREGGRSACVRVRRRTEEGEKANKYLDNAVAVAV